MDTNFRVVILYLLVCVATITSTQVIHRNKFEEGLLKMIDKCKNGDVESLPIPAPSLKRLEIPPIAGSVDGFAVSSSNVYVTGLELLSVETLSASESGQSVLIEFQVPKVKIHADWYHLTGKALFIDINNKGMLKSHVDNLRVKAGVRFAGRGNDTVISNLDLTYSFSDVQASLEDSSFMVNTVVNSKLPDIVKSEHFMGKVKDTVITMSQIYLRGHTPQEFRKNISSF